MIWILVLSITSLLFANFLRNRYRILKYTSKFASPPQHLIFGHLKHFFGKNPKEIFHIVNSFHRSCGKNLIHWEGFNEHLLIVSEPKSTELILSNSKLLHKTLEYHLLDSWLGNGLLVSGGKKWQSRRKLITPTFHYSILDDFMRIFNEQAEIMVAKVAGKVGQPVNVYDFVTLYALDVICEAAMGVQMNAQDQPKSDYVKAVKLMSDIIFKRIFSPFRYIPWAAVLTPTYKVERRSLKILHGFSDSVIQKRRIQLSSEEYQDNCDKKKCFLDLLLKAEEDGNFLSDSDIREEVDTFMFEGHDTTTSGISFTLYHLSRNSEIQEKVYGEIVKVLGNNNPNSFFDSRIVSSLKYLEMVIKESLRITPPVPFIGRQVTEEIFIEGVKIEKGARAGVNIFMMHSDPELYPNPERFDPERFSFENIQKRHPYAFVPFSAGSRNCIGQKFAMQDMKVAIAKMILNFRFEAVDKPLDLEGSLILKSTNGMNLILRRREAL